jgi:hypothetical protein
VAATGSERVPLIDQVENCADDKGNKKRTSRHAVRSGKCVIAEAESSFRRKVVSDDRGYTPEAARTDASYDLAIWAKTSYPKVESRFAASAT